MGIYGFLIFENIDIQTDQKLIYFRVSFQPSFLIVKLLLAYFLQHVRVLLVIKHDTVDREIR